MKKISLLLIILISVVFIHAQEVIFGYDAAGNRISRVIELPPESTPNDSTLKTGELSDIPQVPKQTTTTVITETTDAATVNIYPNPTGGKFTVEIATVKNETTNGLRLHTLTGEQVFVLQNPGSLTEIDLNGHPPGTYILYITIGQKTQTWKIVKQ